MDCFNARMLMQLSGPALRELPRSERGPLDEHLASCSDCAGFAHNDRLVDQALGRAMRNVPIPAGLENRLRSSLKSRYRRAGLWTWVSAAACLFLAVGTATWWWNRSPQDIRFEQFVSVIDSQTAAQPDDVEQWFQDEAGIAMTAPRQFNYKNLESYGVVFFQGQQVPRLVFFVGNEGGRPAALAHVYVLSWDQFHPPPFHDNRVPTITHTIETSVDENGKVTYLVVYTGSSLDPFLRRIGT